MKKMLIAGNWKMNTTIVESTNLVNEIVDSIGNKKYNSRILICPPFTNLLPVFNLVKSTDICLGAQNCYYQSKGAFTGEISIQMLKSVGCTDVIIGHSERRTIFHETDQLINQKIKATIENELIPVFCIGETLDERKSDLTFEVIKRQLDIGLEGIEINEAGNIVIAYEPVWAIGTGISASIDQVEEAHDFIRNELYNKYSDTARDMLILYGGSVTADNAESILRIGNVNGALIGGASLKPESFLTIISASEKILQNS